LRTSRVARRSAASFGPAPSPNLRAVQPPNGRDLASLPVDELALWMLGEMTKTGQATFHRSNFLGRLLKSVGDRIPGDSAYKSDAVRAAEPPHFGRALAEGWGWLLSEGLIAEAATALARGQFPVDGYSLVTRLGERVANHPRAREWMAAERRLGLPLHPRLEERARRQFVLGEFEAAAFIAMREVEIAVRERAGYAGTVIGSELMNKAFASDGPLADPETPTAEQEGLKSLYRGALSVFKNPASHRALDYKDPVEAAEVVLLADLLLRMVDRAPEGVEEGESS
jgi:uncharacterized protein (TIGR02391 family)